MLTCSTGKQEACGLTQCLNTAGLKLFGHLKLSQGDQWIHGMANIAQVLQESCALPEGSSGRTVRAMQTVTVEATEVTALRGFMHERYSNVNHVTISPAYQRLHRTDFTR